MAAALSKASDGGVTEKLVILTSRLGQHIWALQRWGDVQNDEAYRYNTPNDSEVVFSALPASLAQYRIKASLPSFCLYLKDFEGEEGSSRTGSGVTHFGAWWFMPDDVATLLNAIATQRTHAHNHIEHFRIEFASKRFEVPQTRRISSNIPTSDAYERTILLDTVELSLVKLDIAVPARVTSDQWLREGLKRPTKRRVHARWCVTQRGVEQIAAH